MAGDTARQRFARWRRSRPFWGGLLLLLAGLALFFSANLTLADMKVHFGQEGYLSYLLPVILVLCGALIWATPAQRLFYAVIGLVTALYSLIGLNLGGFGVGMVLGIVGGALAIAWTPSRPAPTAPAEAGPEAPPFAWPGDDGPPTDILPGTEDRGTHRKLLVITLVPLLITTGGLVAGAAPVRADDCPKGLPSRSAEPEPRSPSATPSRSPRRTVPTPSPTASPTASPTTLPDPSPAPARSGEDTGNPLADGWRDFVEGVGDLLGIGDDESPAATPSASSPAPGSAKPSPPGKPSTPGPSTSGKPSASADPAPGPTASGLPDVPCLGPRVVKAAPPGDVPVVSLQGGLLEGGRLTMYNSTYDGVVDLPTATGTVKVLKFSMRKSVTKPFSLTIPERGGRTTVIRSNALTTEGNVRFYTPRFSGKLFGLIPVTFTPQQPPPLTLPVLWFTNVKINLAFVRCDTLTADPLDLRERA